MGYKDFAGTGSNCMNGCLPKPGSVVNYIWMS